MEDIVVVFIVVMVEVSVMAEDFTVHTIVQFYRFRFQSQFQSEVQTLRNFWLNLIFEAYPIRYSILQATISKIRLR